MRKFGLIGKSLSHSFSKSFFDSYFVSNEIDASYENFEFQDEIELSNFLNQKNVDGCNVTIPYKETIIPYLDELSEEATAVGAVNTIHLVNNRWIGYNTDVFGFKQSIKPFLTNKHEKALILGTGGAAKAVAYVLKEIGIEVLFVSRSPKGKNQFGYADANEYMINACKLIVNATPVGMYPDVDECVVFPFANLTEEHLVVDLIYNPEETMFLKQSRENHSTILNGASMLKEQAFKSWAIWNK
ncbi:MAG: shikimate dehydrogenase family protein [Crocinitomicaceae bacterium]|jgi:shikimate dehydrogenase